MSGTIGQSKTRAKLQIAPVIMMIVPAIKRKRREKNPMKREISLSKNMCILSSREESALAVSAEIWRNGLNKVRISEFMEKKSTIFDKVCRFFWIKTFQPWAYHQESISKIAIIILYHA